MLKGGCWLGYLLDFASEQSPQVIQQQRHSYPHDCRVRPQTEQKTLLQGYIRASQTTQEAEVIVNRLSLDWGWEE